MTPKPSEADWLPTSENINALPRPIRSYIHDLETQCDPAGTVRDAAVQKGTALALAARVRELEEALEVESAGWRAAEKRVAELTEDRAAWAARANSAEAELAALRQPSRIEAKRPLPPDVLANALQDRIHPASGRLLSASPVAAKAGELPATPADRLDEWQWKFDLVCELRERELIDDEACARVKASLVRELHAMTGKEAP